MERFKLDGLSMDEARTIAPRIIEVIHGLVQHMKVIMKGEQTDSACHPLIVDFSFLLEGKALISRVRDAQGMLLVTIRELCAD